MSLDAMTDRAVNARFREIPVNFVPSEVVPNTLFAQAYNFDVVSGRSAASAPQVSGQISSTNVTATGSALSAIVAYIPTEVVTTYVAILAALFFRYRLSVH